MSEIPSFTREEIDQAVANSAPIGPSRHAAPSLDSRGGSSGDSDSFRSSRQCGERIETDPFEIVPISALGPSEPPDWIWPGYVARRAITLFSGIWKAGKTTLLSHLIRDMQRGAGLLEISVDVLVLLVSEESDGLWAARRDDLEMTDNILIQRRPAIRRPDRTGWLAQIDATVRAVRERDIALVILDTLPALWPVLNENDASEVLDAMTPLREISEAGAAVVLGHHFRKGDGNEGTASRGSGALPGFVDIIVELRRYARGDNADTRRVLAACGRFDDIPAEVVFELGGDGFRSIGERTEAWRQDLEASIVELLPHDGPGWCFDEVFDAWTNAPKPGRTRLRAALNEGADEGRWARSGGGKRNDLHRFLALSGFEPDSFQSRHALGERNESEAER